MTLSPAMRALLDQVITQDEGGWVLTSNENDPDGGWTYAGVTARTFSAWWASRGQVLRSRDQMAALIASDLSNVVDDVYSIYESEFVFAGHVAEVPEPLARAYLSAIINLGVPAGIRVLQRTFMLYDDGIWGPNTANACAAANSMKQYSDRYITTFRQIWQAHYISIACVSADEFAGGVALALMGRARAWTNLPGWIARAERACAGAVPSQSAVT